MTKYNLFIPVMILLVGLANNQASEDKKESPLCYDLVCIDGKCTYQNWCQQDVDTKEKNKQQAPPSSDK